MLLDIFLKRTHTMIEAVLTSVRLIEYPAYIACTMNYHTSIIIVLRILFVNVGPNIAAM